MYDSDVEKLGDDSMVEVSDGVCIWSEPEREVVSFRSLETCPLSSFKGETMRGRIRELTSRVHEAGAGAVA